MEEILQQERKKHKMEEGKIERLKERKKHKRKKEEKEKKVLILILGRLERKISRNIKMSFQVNEIFFSSM